VLKRHASTPVRKGKDLAIRSHVWLASRLPSSRRSSRPRIGAPPCGWKFLAPPRPQTHSITSTRANR